MVMPLSTPTETVLDVMRCLEELGPRGYYTARHVIEFAVDADIEGVPREQQLAMHTLPNLHRRGYLRKHRNAYCISLGGWRYLQARGIIPSKSS